MTIETTRAADAMLYERAHAALDRLEAIIENRMEPLTRPKLELVHDEEGGKEA